MCIRDRVAEGLGGDVEGARDGGRVPAGGKELEDMVFLFRESLDRRMVRGLDGQRSELPGHLLHAGEQFLVVSAHGNVSCQAHEEPAPGPLIVEDNRRAVSYTHLRAHETPEHLVCRLLLEKK